MPHREEPFFKPDYYIELALKHRWLIIIPFCLAMIIGIGLVFTLPRTYEASTLILVRPQRVPEKYVSSIVSSDIESRISTISQQILSRTNLEKIINKKVMDRSGLILDIFANNARTKESKTQVELAQLNYLLPRLTRRWTHLERQDGAIGLRGPGETQLETDKRLINNRIKKLKKELSKIETQRSTQRKSRSTMFRASLIGYTNSGKSTTMNLLTDASVLVENKLFATLDSTIKKLTFNDKSTLLLSDTVGFIKKLPHQMIASFKSTLEEVRASDILIHVIDISHKNFREQIDIVNSVLHELQINDKLTVNVFNKIDLLNDEWKIQNVKEEFPEGIFISAKLGLGIQNLINRIHDILSEQYFEGEYVLPGDFNEDISRIYKLCDSVKIIRRKQNIKIKYRVKKELKDSILGELKKISSEETVNCTLQ